MHNNSEASHFDYSCEYLCSTSDQNWLPKCSTSNISDPNKSFIELERQLWQQRQRICHESSENPKPIIYNAFGGSLMSLSQYQEYNNNNNNNNNNYNYNNKSNNNHQLYQQTPQQHQWSQRHSRQQQQSQPQQQHMRMDQRRM